MEVGLTIGNFSMLTDQQNPVPFQMKSEWMKAATLLIEKTIFCVLRLWHKEILTGKMWYGSHFPLRLDSYISEKLATSIESKANRQHGQSSSRFESETQLPRPVWQALHLWAQTMCCLNMGRMAGWTYRRSRFSRSRNRSVQSSCPVSSAWLTRSIAYEATETGTVHALA